MAELDSPARTLDYEYPFQSSDHVIASRRRWIENTSDGMGAVPVFKMALIGQNLSQSGFLNVQCATDRIPPQFSEFLFVGMVAG
jgi:hypothetical protein